MAADERSSRPRSGDRSGRGGSSKNPKGQGQGKGTGKGKDPYGRPRRPAGEREEPRTAGPKQWGSLGRKGAGRLTAPDFDARGGVGATGRDERPRPDQTQDQWIQGEEVRTEASKAVSRSKQGKGAAPGKGPNQRKGPKGSGATRDKPRERRGRDYRNAGAGSGGADAKAELVRALGGPRGAKANDKLRDAAHAFERERYEEARSLLKPLADQAPQAASVRELLGLTYYRLGRWKDSIRELEAFRLQTGSTEQNPVLADAYRAQRKHAQVEELWDELRESSPSADLVAEGRIVMAGSLADRNRLADAIVLVEKSQRKMKRVEVHHLRQGYVLADLYERAGDAARARELFRWVVQEEPDFADAAERASALA